VNNSYYSFPVASKIIQAKLKTCSKKDSDGKTLKVKAHVFITNVHKINLSVLLQTLSAT